MQFVFFAFLSNANSEIRVLHFSSGLEVSTLYSKSWPIVALMYEMEWKHHWNLVW